MAKTILSFLRENKAAFEQLHGTPFLVVHDRKKMVNEDTSVPSFAHQLNRYPNQNEHLSGRLPPEEDHSFHTHNVLTKLIDGIHNEDEMHVHYEHTVSSHHTNNLLWERHTSEPAWAPNLPGIVRHLDPTLTKFKIPTGGLTTFSGLPKDPTLHIQKHPEKKLFLPAYTSTSINTQVAGLFAQRERTPGLEVRHIMKFHFPEGMKAGTYLGEKSHHPTEYEFLARRGMSVHVHPEPEILPYRTSHPDTVEGHLKIWNATPLSFHEK